MPTDILMPQLSPTMTEGRLARWVVAVGDAVRAGQVIAEVETDKATMEVEAVEDGVIHSIIGNVGEDVAVGTPIGVLRGAKEKVPADYKPKGKMRTAPPEQKMAATLPTSSTHAVHRGVPVLGSSPLVTDIVTLFREWVPKRVKASPLARKLAFERGVNLENLSPSGPHDRVIARDVLRGSTKSVAAMVQPSFPTSPPVVVREGDMVVKLSPMRKAIAARLTQAKQTVPHFYLKITADILALQAKREIWVQSGKSKWSLNDAIIKACALALKDHPAANAGWNHDSIVQFGSVDISVAVAIEGGLITPIVAKADGKSLTEIATEMKLLAATARAGQLKPHQYEGGSFSISNLGMYGVDEFAAIINPPQSGILAVGKANADGKLVLTASFDHRVIDGALGAELLGAIRGYLEKPELILH